MSSDVFSARRVARGVFDYGTTRAISADGAPAAVPFMATTRT
jgi:hypothetical protein